MGPLSFRPYYDTGFGSMTEDSVRMMLELLGVSYDALFCGDITGRTHALECTAQNLRAMVESGVIDAFIDTDIDCVLAWPGHVSYQDAFRESRFYSKICTWMVASRLDKETHRWITERSQKMPCWPC